jgi:hypothetical protein
MIHIISNSNLENIKSTANEILVLLKSKKIFLSSKYNDDIKLKASNSLLEITRAFSETSRFNSITSEDNSARIELQKLTETLSELLLNKTKFMTHKLKDYSKEIKPKLCRELISDLEDLFIFAEINRDDIDHVYATLGKITPKKFSANDLKEDGKEIYRAIRSAIKDKAEVIKSNSIAHYINMVNLIDPDDTIKTPKEFVKIGRDKISDMSTLRLCLAYKFKVDLFSDLINHEFETLLTVASNQICGHNANQGENPEIKVNDVQLGGKGFDIHMSIDGIRIHARAVPVNGYFVLFHYRYIIKSYKD